MHDEQDTLRGPPAGTLRMPCTTKIIPIAFPTLAQCQGGSRQKQAKLRRQHFPTTPPRHHSRPAHSTLASPCCALQSSSAVEPGWSLISSSTTPALLESGGEAIAKKPGLPSPTCRKALRRHGESSASLSAGAAAHRTGEAQEQCGSALWAAGRDRQSSSQPRKAKQGVAAPLLGGPRHPREARTLICTNWPGCV